MGSELQRAHNGPGDNKVGEYVVDRKKHIGAGSFGFVYKGKHTQTGMEVALKKSEIRNEYYGAQALKEIKNLLRIPEHKHIVKMLDFEYKENSFWIILEYCDRGDLDHYVKKYAPNLERQLKIMYQCACAVSHMHNHEQPIVHRDIKPKNILFKKQGDREVVKIADFGLTSFLESSSGGGNAHNMLSSHVGSRAYMAPEIYAHKNYDESVDIFALGLVFVALINHKPTDQQLFPLSATAMDMEKLIPFGEELWLANCEKLPIPLLVKSSPLDSDKMKGLKNLICDMTLYAGQERKKIKDVVADLQKISSKSRTSNPESMILSTSAPFTLSNLSLAQTNASSLLSSTSTELGAASSIGTIVGTSTIQDENTVTADSGYRLMRKVLEDVLRKKKEREIHEAPERKRAEKIMEMLPLFALFKLIDGDQELGNRFQVGDRATVDSDIARAKELQKGHGEWVEGMETYLDEEGRVITTTGNVVNVQFLDGKKLRFNALLLTKTGVAETMAEPSGGKLIKGRFKMLDIVIFKVNESQLVELQTGHGGYNKRMKNVLKFRGVVHRILSYGDVVVEFINNDLWHLNPEALEIFDSSGFPIEAGDNVLILDNKDIVVKLQKDHGGWVNVMGKCLGRSGIVKKVVQSRVAFVEVGGFSLAWNLKALKLIAKSEEMIEVMVQKLFKLELAK